MGAEAARKRLDIATGVCGAFIVLTGVALVRSPFLDPAGFRVPDVNRQALPQDRPNVLWIVLDTVRADRMSVYGYDKETTPFLERWGRRATVFDRAISDGMWTVPAHSSMFTGLSLRQHGVDHEHLWLDDSFTTVAEVLSKHGYRTVSFSGNPFIAAHTNLVQGFGAYHVAYHLRHLTRFSLEFLGEKLGITPPFAWIDRDLGAAMSNQMIADWLDSHAGRETPVFMFVNYMEAHLPYLAPRAYRRMFMTPEQVERSYDLRQRAHGNIVSTLDTRFNIDGPGFLPGSDREVLKRQYEACLRYLDDRVAELISMFEQRGLLDNTLVVIASDHGEHLDTHGMWSHRFLAYNDLVHVPIILRYPGQQQPVRVSTPVQLSDLYPTVLHAVLGADAPDPGSGARDLFEVIAQNGEPRIVISAYGGPSKEGRDRVLKRNDPNVTHRMRPQIAAQDRRFKYISSYDGTRELYDLVADPEELKNLVGVIPAEAKRLASYINHWLERVPLYQAPSVDERRETDPAIRDALRGLGYVD